MVTLSSLSAARLSSALSRAHAAAMEVRIAVAEAHQPELSSFLDLLQRAKEAIEQYQPESDDEFRELSKDGLRLAETVRHLASDFPQLAEAYDKFALEAEDLALAAHYEPDLDQSDYRSIDEMR